MGSTVCLAGYEGGILYKNFRFCPTILSLRSIPILGSLIVLEERRGEKRTKFSLNLLRSKIADYTFIFLGRFVHREHTLSLLFLRIYNGGLPVFQSLLVLGKKEVREFGMVELVFSHLALTWKRKQGGRLGLDLVYDGVTLQRDV